MQAGGHRFDPDRLHQLCRVAIVAERRNISRMKTSDPAGYRPVGGDLAAVFDIVNGFLNRCRGGIVASITIDAMVSSQRSTIKLIIWLRYILHTYHKRSLYAGLSLMVWILKREVRAFGGCLGMYRR